MRNKTITQFMALFVGCIGFIACSDNADNEYDNINGGIGKLPLNIRIANTDLPENLECTMYIFGKTGAASNYILKDSIHLNAENRRILPYAGTDWNEENYRFLFIAMPPENAGLTLTNHNDANLERAIDTWKNVRIKAADTKSISGDCYFGILDKTKEEIADSRLISGEIKRLVGQMAIDIFRVDEQGAPMNKQDAYISTVLDRVYQIDFAYTGLTDEISFDTDGEPVWLTTKTLTETSMNIALGDTLQMYVDENPLLTVAPEGVEGSVRIKNLFCLPSTDNVKLKVTFHYYDTTPTCGITEKGYNHYEEEDCFVTKTIELNLPQNNNEKDYLDILPNYYTVNKAGIPLDRVIDLLQPGSYGLNTTWENEK